MKKFILLTCVLLLIGCNNKSATGTGQTKKHIEITTVKINNDIYYEDFDYMINILEESYPFFGVLKREGIDFDEIQERYRNKIGHEQLNHQRFYHIIDKMLDELNYTGHIHAVSQKQYDWYKDSHMTPWYDAANTESSQAYYTAINLPTLTTTIKNVTNNITTQTFDESSTAYIRIDSFSYANIEQDYETLSAYYEIAKYYDNIVFDIRNNGGGSTNYFTNNIVAPLIKEEVTYTTHMLFNQGDYNLPFISFKLQGDLSKIKDISDLDLTQYPDFNTDDLDYLSHLVINNQTILPTTEGYDGNIYVLVGPKVYSSSEAFTDFCKSTQFATLVGHQTGGDGIGFDPIVVSLPNSGVMISYSTIYGMMSSGKNSEEFGTTPDILLEDNINAFDYLMKALSEGTL